MVSLPLGAFSLMPAMNVLGPEGRQHSKGHGDAALLHVVHWGCPAYGLAVDTQVVLVPL